MHAACRSRNVIVRAGGEGPPLVPREPFAEGQGADADLPHAQRRAEASQQSLSALT